MQLRQCEALKSERTLEVVFICGKGGTGKTYYAKKMLKSLGYDFCVSSSSNDPFQDYSGQRAMILDDLRGRQFSPNYPDMQVVGKVKGGRRRKRGSVRLPRFFVSFKGYASKANISVAVAFAAAFLLPIGRAVPQTSCE